jgi:hypothetical protein
MTSRQIKWFSYFLQFLAGLQIFQTFKTHGRFVSRDLRSMPELATQAAVYAVCTPTRGQCRQSYLKRRIEMTTEWVFDKDGKVLGRILTEEECKAMSHDDLLQVALGRWISNTPLFAVQLIRCLDGTCGTYVEADPDKSEMNGITVFEVKEGEDPEVVYRREAAE